MKIFFSVGEPSGDLHGANLIRALRKRHDDWQFVGYGGPKMAEAGCELNADLTQLAVMWVLQVIQNYHKFRRLLKAAEKYFREERPDLVVLIDYPGFNWHIARKAKEQGIPVLYYGTPQLWAWASWRVKKMRRDVDHVLCKLPFEEKWFRERGCQATFVGHPYFDELEARQLDEAFLADQRAQQAPLVTILPGSRTMEVKRNLPGLVRAAERIRDHVPNVRFAVAAYKDSQLPLVQKLLADVDLPVETHVGRTAELIHSARCCMACSGSVSLELLYDCRPSVIQYQVSRFGYFVQSIFRKVRYITLVNLLTATDPFEEQEAGIYDPADPRDHHVLMPEYLSCRDRSADLAEHVVGWLSDENEYSRRVQQLEQLKAEVAHGGASERAAEYISQLASGSGSQPLRQSA